MCFDAVKENLTQKGFSVSCFETKEDAAVYLSQRINNVTVGFGGSVTLQEMGLYDLLSPHNKVFWHWQKPDALTGEEVIRMAQTADVYLSSVNGLAKTGEIVNIDGVGNRVSGTLYGHKKVYFVVGRNKLTDRLSAAIDRARNIAAPKNAKRLNKNTPCAKRGDRCYDCDSPERICRELSVLWRRPLGGDYEVVLVNEDLGY